MRSSLPRARGNKGGKKQMGKSIRRNKVKKKAEIGYRGGEIGFFKAGQEASGKKRRKRGIK